MGDELITLALFYHWLESGLSISIPRPHAKRLRAPMPIEISSINRDHLAMFFQYAGFRKGAEIGVAEGHYSEVLCKTIPELELWCVDPWIKYPENPRAHKPEHQEFSKSETIRRTQGYNVHIVQAMSMDAVRGIPENSLDFVYIDGHHSYSFVMSDIIEWSKRVRSGGVVALDDFYEFRWAGVVEAVQSYTRAIQISPWFMIDAPHSVDVFWIKP